MLDVQPQFYKYPVSRSCGYSGDKLQIMWNYGAIDKTPTVNQVKAIINHMENDSEVGYNFNMMMGMSRPEPNKILLDLHNAHFGITYEILFSDEGLITKFEKTGSWMS